MMISDFAIKRPIVTVTVMLALVVFGLFSLFQLDTDEFPDVVAPVVTTTVIYPGASPDVVEREVTDPIEEAISGISGVRTVRSQSLDGYSWVMTEFAFSKDLQEAMQEVRDKIGEIRGDLRRDRKPILGKFSEPTSRSSRRVASNVLDGPSYGVGPTITRELRRSPASRMCVSRSATDRRTPPEALQQPAWHRRWCRAAAQNLAAPVGRINGSLDEDDSPAWSLEARRISSSLRGGERTGHSLGQVAACVTGRRSNAPPRPTMARRGRPRRRKSKGYSTTDVAARVIARLDEIRPRSAGRCVVREAGRSRRTPCERRGSALQGGPYRAGGLCVLNSWRSRSSRAWHCRCRFWRRSSPCWFRLHAQHHVADGAVARDRYPDRRRDCRP
jgi:HAE1 family hydrophobic/amphiphilic exporter-1